MRSSTKIIVLLPSYSSIIVRYARHAGIAEAKPTNQPRKRVRYHHRYISEVMSVLRHLSKHLPVRGGISRFARTARAGRRETHRRRRGHESACVGRCSTCGWQSPGHGLIIVSPGINGRVGNGRHRLAARRIKAAAPVRIRSNRTRVCLPIGMRRNQ